ncbi:MAG: glycosyltransferase [Gemmatimonadaceae bacterium]
MARIAILSGLQLSTNPRVVKEADTLSRAGHDVEVLGATLEIDLASRDRQLLEGKAWTYTVLVDAESHALAKRLSLFLARARKRLGSELYARFGIITVGQLGIAGPAMLRHCLARPADLYVAHNPQSLWVGMELLRRGRAVAVDMEDWHSEDLLPEDRRGYPVDALRRWERTVLRGAAFSTTTSKRLAEALAESYDCPAPAVVYNSFSLRERDAIDGETRDRIDRGIPSLCWFSQVVGRGRGLETLLDALPDVRIPFEIHLRGKCGAAYRESLLARAPADWRTRIHFHDQVPHEELISRLAEHDVGFAGELPFCRSRDLTITNKILQYLLAGVAVVASDTAGQREVADMADGGVVTFAAGQPRGLADALNLLLGEPERLRTARDKALLAAERYFCWERSVPVLLEQVARALKRSEDSRTRHAIQVSA